MRIVELTGQPCAGKSIFARASAVNSEIVLFNRAWLFDALHIPVKSNVFGRIFYEILMLYGGLRGVKYKIFIKYLRACLQINSSFYRKANVLRNILHKYAVYEFAGKVEDERLLLVDEGLSHIPYIFSDCLDVINTNLFLEFKQKKPWVLKITSSSAEVKRRLEIRGHSRVDGTSHSIKTFINDNEKCSTLQDELMMNYKKIISIDLTEKQLEAEAQEAFAQIRSQY